MKYRYLFPALFLLPLISIAANVDLSKMELLRKMDKATFKNPEKKLETLAVSWVNDGQFFLKRTGDLYRLNVYDMGIMIRNSHAFYTNGKEVPKDENPEGSLFFLNIIFPFEPFVSIFKGDEWQLLPEFAVKNDVSYYCLSRKELQNIIGYRLLINPKTFHIDQMASIYPDEDGKVQSSHIYIENYQWIGDAVCLPMLFSPEKGQGTPSYVSEIKVNEKIDESYFDPAYSAPAAKLTLEQLDALRLQNLPGKNLPDGTLKTIVHFGYEKNERILKYLQKTQTFGEEDFDICFGIKNLKDLVPAPKIEPNLVLVNDVWCIQVTVPRISIEPTTGMILRVDRRTQSKANFMYEKRDGKFYPRIIIASDEAFHYPIQVQWIPDK